MKTFLLATVALVASSSAMAVPQDFPAGVAVIYGTSYDVLKERCPQGQCDAQYVMDAMKEVKKLNKEQLNAYTTSSKDWNGEWGYDSNEVDSYIEKMGDTRENKLTDQLEVKFKKVGKTVEITLTSNVPAINIANYPSPKVVDGDCTGEDYQWMYRTDTSGPLYPLGLHESVKYTTRCSTVKSIKVVTNLGTAVFNN